MTELLSHQIVCDFSKLSNLRVGITAFTTPLLKNLSLHGFPKQPSVPWKSKGQNPELWPAGPALLLALCKPAGLIRTNLKERDFQAQVITVGKLSATVQKYKHTTPELREVLQKSESNWYSSISRNNSYHWRNHVSLDIGLNINLKSSISHASIICRFFLATESSVYLALISITHSQSVTSIILLKYLPMCVAYW